MKYAIAMTMIASGLLAQNTVDAKKADAIDSLRAIRSVTEVGVNYRDYSSRVADAKVKVDRFLEDAKADPQAKLIAETMRAYVLSARTLAPNASLDAWLEAGQAAESEPGIADCNGISETAAGWVAMARKQRLPIRSDRDRWGYIGSMLKMKPGVLWGCAATKLDALKAEGAK